MRIGKFGPDDERAGRRADIGLGEFELARQRINRAVLQLQFHGNVGTGDLDTTGVDGLTQIKQVGARLA